MSGGVRQRAQARKSPGAELKSGISLSIGGDKPHACELCHKKFALACNLRAHMKTHEGDTQEECIRCGKVYLSSAANQMPRGFCSDCYSSNQGAGLIKDHGAARSIRGCDSASEESCMTEEREEEDDNHVHRD
ncbi:unnamed protein product [Bemisia tabaci]|uniref:C2H2-type domain-containing protein n=1 Tax=Bemisia tabaci TaxID=7038 RepID=A0A9P0F1M3_BEMTA|nr:unnamed protein product [Bemisia tabaci]